MQLSFNDKKRYEAFVIKEAKHILRDKRTMLILFGMPVVMMLLFGFAITTDVKNVRTVVVTSEMSPRTQQAMFVMWFFVVSIMLLSGLFTPTRSMPQWAYMTTYINPMHYFIDAIRTVYIRGGGLHETAHQVLSLAGIGTLMGYWAVQSYKKNN